MMKRDELEKIADIILKNSDADHTSVLIKKNDNKLTRFANSTIHQNVFQENLNISIFANYGKRSGTAYLNKLDEESILRSLKNLRSSVMITKEDPDHVTLPSGKTFNDHIKNFDEETAVLEEVRMADITGSIIKKIVDKNAEAFGAFNSGISYELLKNSHNNSAYSKRSYVDIVCIPIRNDRSTYNRYVNKGISHFNVDEFLEIPLQRLEHYKNFQEIEHGEYNVLLEHFAVSDMIAFFNWLVFSGKSFAEKQSYISDRLNEKITGDNINITDDWENECSPGLPYDHELQDREKLDLIENGIAKDIALDTKWANKLGRKSNGHASFGVSFPMASDIVLRKGTESFSDILSGMEDGLLITKFHYTNVINPKLTTYTGLTRNGIYKVENGKIAHAVNNLRFTISIVETLKNVLKLGNKDHGDRGIVVCDALIKDFNFTGKTQY